VHPDRAHPGEQGQRQAAPAARDKDRLAQRQRQRGRGQRVHLGHRGLAEKRHAHRQDQRRRRAAQRGRAVAAREVSDEARHRPHRDRRAEGAAEVDAEGELTDGQEGRERVAEEHEDREAGGVRHPQAHRRRP
jgi:hypothetical protein